MRQALRANTARRQLVGSPRPIPAPTLGWFASENDLDLPSGSAKVLINWWPQPDTVSLRKGSKNWFSGLPGPVETVLVYRSGLTEKLFAASVNGLYDGTAGGTAAGFAYALTEPRMSWTNISVSGGQYLIACNGVDAPIKYNGTFTGISIADGGPSNAHDLNFVWQYRSRLYFLSKNNPSQVYFLPADSIGGTMNVMAVGAQMSLGGKLIAGGRWTVDAGLGPDDVFVVVSDQGEVIVYSGRDPLADTWSIVGVYRVGKPVGARCLVNIGGDMAILCEDGVVPLSSLVKVDRSQQRKISVTANIAKAFNTAIRELGRGDDWQLHLWPSGSMLLANMPGGVQFAMNTLNGAWTQFQGVPALCWAVFGDHSYYGTADGRVVKFWHGSTDSSTPIRALMIPAFDRLGYTGLKSVSLMRLNMISAARLNVKIGLSVDYDQNLAYLVALDFTGTGSPWDTSAWDVTPWGDIDELRRQPWQGVGGVGYVFAPIIQAETLDLGPDFEIDCRAISFDIVAANGGIL